MKMDPKSGIQPSNGACSVCKDGRYQPLDGTTNACAAHSVTSCDAGEELSTAPSASLDGACTPCPTGRYQHLDGVALQCAVHSVTSCDAGSELTTAPSATSNGVCTSCPHGTAG